MNQLSLFKDIIDFHKKFDLKPLDSPGFLDSEYMKFRIRFMQEELDEFFKAYTQDNLHDAFDALIDLTYVVLGTAFLMGLPFENGWYEVHKCNMQKIRATTKNDSKRKHQCDVIKPTGWAPPNLNKFLDKKE